MKFLTKAATVSLFVLVSLIAITLIVYSPEKSSNTACEMPLLTSKRIIVVLDPAPDLKLPIINVDTHIFITSLENDNDNKGKVVCLVKKVFSAPFESWEEDAKALIIHNLTTGFTLIFNGDVKSKAFDLILLFTNTDETEVTMWFFHWPDINMGIEDAKNENIDRGLLLMQTQSTPVIRDEILDTLTNGVFSEMMKRYENSFSVMIKTAI